MVACPLCAAATTAAHKGQGLVCGACLSAPPAFDETVAAFQYRFPLDRLVHSFKFSANLTLTALFSEALLAAIESRAARTSRTLPARIIPLPLANKRLAGRGFNQSAELAEAVAKKLRVPYSACGLLKIRDTPPQSGLGRQARLKNVRGAFECGDLNDIPAGQHIAIVDDVMTTGATLSEAARVLKKAGAGFVSAWVVARADPFSGPENGDMEIDEHQEGAIPF